MTADEGTCETSNVMMEYRRGKDGQCRNSKVMMRLDEKSSLRHRWV